MKKGTLKGETLNHMFVDEHFDTVKNHIKFSNLIHEI